MRGFRLKKFIALFCSIAATVLIASFASAGCTAISEPTENAGLETIKIRMQERRFNTAFGSFEIEDSAKKSVVDQISGLSGEGELKCVTLRRVRQSEYFISEVVLFESDSTIFYFTISGETASDEFRMINFWATTDFDKIRGFLY
ncbi:hypothetical protein [uncultured Ruegeria sp.]|uniref:hypothetical protein n=1 Tax=uncultured Ruegeria sp. TaxID=259304 RepID=UPI002629A041|nr:hypothetical protein [uncultured Ruegeria sp.]